MSLKNVLRYGFGPKAKERKKQAKIRQRTEKFKDRATWGVDEKFARRKYSSYEEYLAHQAAKLKGHLPQLRDTEEQDFQEFRRRFSTCAQLSEMRSVLCLGARLGTEVRALHSLGYFAVGIDLNPGDDNRFVLPGDFHNLVFPNSCVDAIYTNAIDHSFDLSEFVKEVTRVLRPSGIFIVDFQYGFSQGQDPGDYEATFWESSHALIEAIGSCGGLSLQHDRPLGVLRISAWHEAVFRKKVAGTGAQIPEPSVVKADSSSNLDGAR